jgi:hypothetical protein
MKVITSRWTPSNCRTRSINKPWHQYVGMGECALAPRPIILGFCQARRFN